MAPITQGRYQGRFSGNDHKVIVRVGRHEDGRLDNVSGDVFEATAHLLSFVGNAASLVEEAGGSISGKVSFFSDRTLPRTGSRIVLARQADADDAPVMLTLNIDGGDISAVLSWVAAELRTLQVNIDGLSSLPVPHAQVFDGDPSGQDLVAAFKRASIDATVNVRPFRPDPGGRQKHSIGELHALMEDWNRPPQGIGESWHLHVLFAGEFEGRGGSDVSGVMYDIEPQTRPPRQGLAVFLNSRTIRTCLPANSANWRREVLFTLVHEIGHALNLPHAFEDNRAQALTWMNYPNRMPTGTDAFWASFQGMFDQPELNFLRHAPFADIAPGQSDYAQRKSSFLSGGDFPALMAKSLSAEVDAAKVRATLSIAPLKSTYVFGEPVFLKLAVTNNGRNPLSVAKALDPSDGFASIRVVTPSGKLRTIRPPAVLCQHVPTISLGYRKTLSFDGILASFDADGALFDEPGRYRLEATFTGIGGATLKSAPSYLRVLHPTRNEELFAIAIWDDNALMRAIYCRQPLLALDSWRRLMNEQARRLPEDTDNTTMAYLRYIAAVGWMARFAPASWSTVHKPNRRKAAAFLRMVEPRHLPQGVGRRRRELLKRET